MAGLLLLMVIGVLLLPYLVSTQRGSRLALDQVNQRIKGTIRG